MIENGFSESQKVTSPIAAIASRCQSPLPTTAQHSTIGRHSVPDVFPQYSLDWHRHRYQRSSSARDRAQTLSLCVLIRRAVESERARALCRRARVQTRSFAAVRDRRPIVRHTRTRGCGHHHHHHCGGGGAQQAAGEIAAARLHTLVEYSNK